MQLNLILLMQENDERGLDIFQIKITVYLTVGLRKIKKPFQYIIEQGFFTSL